MYYLSLFLKFLLFLKILEFLTSIRLQQLVVFRSPAVVPPPCEPEVAAAVLAARSCAVGQPQHAARLLAHLHVGRAAAAAAGGASASARSAAASASVARRRRLRPPGKNVTLLSYRNR